MLVLNYNEIEMSLSSVCGIIISVCTLRRTLKSLKSVFIEMQKCLQAGIIITCPKHCQAFIKKKIYILVELRCRNGRRCRLYCF